MTTRIAINGFGRIGRNVYRALRERNPELEVVAVNDITDTATLAHLLKHDTILGAYPGTVGTDAGGFVVDGQHVRVLCDTQVRTLPWTELEVDIVIEATGHYRDREGCTAHLAAGARKVIVTAPAKGEDLTVCLGVNEKLYDPERHHIVSNASCTTNCLAPAARVLHESFGIEYGLMTTVHAYTGDQRLLDAPHKDLRRARAAAQAIIPTTTGAARAMALVMPELAGRLDGMSLRVPVADVSLVDLTVRVERPVTVAEVLAALRTAAAGPLEGILGVSDEPLVSADFLRDSRSSIVDAASTMVIGDRMVKVLAWYDNEWGYSCRVADLAAIMALALPARTPLEAALV